MSFHPFHIVERSPWPITSAFSALFLTSGTIFSIWNINNTMMILGIIMLTLSAYQWWRDIIRESTFQGHHTIKVVNGLKMGMILFIISEIFFFFSFFWSYFHGMLSPDIEIGMTWPPQGIKAFNPFAIPLLNTTILLCSGISITWSHHSILNKDKKTATLSLFLTILLGAYFTMLQMFEYMEAPFTMTDSMFGSIFFLATGFHGMHVIIGSLFLTVTLRRMMKSHFSNTHHFGFEASAWYWHFVDVVWLFLYVFVYWWIY
uniref:Cytochrome c oxidase subunit 3 n=1 Tax=Macrocheles glaber TaxID=99226 RepID=A0A6B9WGW0_9ACAR|nr:cytochrome c oxidase subunit III [Macrocheles glaber]QHQ98514.1 cytochrome oxidase subunit 3 [Macrocheles glaber]